MMTVPPFTQLELFMHGLKSMKANFNIFPDQHTHEIWTSLPLWSVLETSVRNIICKATWCSSRRMV
jgi:hypothetical protein